MSSGPNAAVLVIGDEVLSGKVRDENGAFALATLRRWGVAVERMAVVRDRIDEVVTELNLCRRHYTYVFTSGGIGPTHDDITIEALAKAFERPVTHDPGLLDKLGAYYGRPLTAAQQRLASIPEGAELIEAGQSWLPVIRQGNVYVLPGIPSLFAELLLSLESRLRSPGFVGRAVFLSCDEPEIADHLTSVQGGEADVAIGSYPKLAHDAPYRVKVTCEGRDATAVERVFAALLEGLPKSSVLGTESY